MQKSTLLFVISIIMIVFGGIGCLGGLGMMAGGSILGSAMASTLVAGVAVILGLIAVISGALMLTAGILGVKNHKYPEKAKSCIILAIILLVLQGIGIVMNLVSGTFGITNITGLIIPVLYYLGAKQLQDMA